MKIRSGFVSNSSSSSFILSAKLNEKGMVEIPPGAFGKVFENVDALIKYHRDSGWIDNDEEEKRYREYYKDAPKDHVVILREVDQNSDEDDICWNFGKYDNLTIVYDEN